MKVTRDADGKVVSTTRSTHPGARGCGQLFLIFLAIMIIGGLIATALGHGG